MFRGRHEVFCCFPNTRKGRLAPRPRVALANVERRRLALPRPPDEATKPAVRICGIACLQMVARNRPAGRI